VVKVGEGWVDLEPSLAFVGLSNEKMSYCILECLSIWVFVLNWLYFNSIVFFKISSICQIKKNNQLSKLKFNFNSTFLYCNNSNNWTFQITEFLSFKLPNYFKFWINVKIIFFFLINSICQIKKNVINYPN